MDYDLTSMPEAYDRGRAPPSGVLEMWMDRLAAHLPAKNIRNIIDLGCGTGRFTGLLALKFGAEVIGIDPSQKMLAQAVSKPWPETVKFMNGSGEHMPCAPSSADLVFSSMAFHHFSSPAQVARECHRVLRPNAYLAIRNSTKESGSPYQDYFPNYEEMLKSLPSAKNIFAAFVDNGFLCRIHESVTHKMADSLAALAEKAALRADTTLLRLADQDFEAGIDRMRNEGSTRTDPIFINIDLHIFQRE